MTTATESALESSRDVGSTRGGRRRPLGKRMRSWGAAIWFLPALAVYAAFVLYPLFQSIRYSFYNWDGVGVATSAGLSNYVAIFTQPVLRDSIIHAFVLILFFTVFPVAFGLIAAELIHRLRNGAASTVARVLIFIPQVIPLAGAAIAWTWLYAQNGLINGFLRAIGLGAITRDWLGDFDTALPAVGIIGFWVALGLCTLLLVAGIGKIDPALYEAAELDGAGRIRQFAVVTLPDLRREVVVCVTVTIISALTSFDLVYVSTKGGPGYQTMVPGVKIYQLIFENQQIGVASALGITLAVLVFIVVLPIQRLGREKS